MGSAPTLAGRLPRRDVGRRVAAGRAGDTGAVPDPRNRRESPAPVAQPAGSGGRHCFSSPTFHLTYNEKNNMFAEASTIAFAVLILAIVFAVKTLKIVPQQHAWVIERLGKYDRT